MSQIVPELNLRRPSVFMRALTNEMNGFHEGKPVIKNQFINRTLAVLTSGGDSPGMNSAVRAIVRMSIYLGCKVYLIHEGYQGLVEGGTKNIQLATWNIVSGIVGLGGTIIGSARCQEFRERSGRLKAARNLVKAGINNLVCIGGDGTLTGANIFKKEWSSLLEELVQKDQITFLEQIQNKSLSIVGIVASIDNDFSGTDMTIGADSALHRIIEAIDAISTTALSHQRCFVLEVMGRNCGYLALSAGLASEADWILIPENPPDVNWEETFCKRLSYHREAGHRLNIVIVAEGAIDKQGNRISSDYVKNIISDRLKIDTRITILGHVQRGGTPSAYDRILGARMGCEAVLALMMHPQNSRPLVIGINGNQTCYIPLEESVEKTRAISKAISDKDFARAIELRGPSFKRNLETYLRMSKLESPSSIQPFLPSNVKELLSTVNEQNESATKEDETASTDKEIPTKESNQHQQQRKSYKFAVLNMGAPSCGVNSVIRSFVRHGVAHGCTILAVHDGFEGLIADRVKELKWTCVYGWTGVGGSLLGCQRVDAKQVGYRCIADKLREYRIDGLLLIGGFEAFTSVIQLSERRAEFKEFRIPLICVPATISNNVPGSDFSIGCDTALNEIVLICDKIKQSAIGSTRRVFLVETMGGYCGYLASSSGLAAGADQSYIFEEKFTINDLIDDIRHFKMKMEGDLKRGLLIRNEMANKNYTSEFIQSLMSEEGKGVFSARMNVIGHMQQGGVPSPFDRNLGIKFGARSLRQMIEIIESAESKDEASLVIGIRRNQILFTPVNDLIDNTDFEHRLPKKQWWLNMRPLNRILGKHEAIYTSEVLFENDLKIEDKDEKDDEFCPSIY